MSDQSEACTLLSMVPVTFFLSGFLLSGRFTPHRARAPRTTVDRSASAAPQTDLLQEVTVSLLLTDCNSLGRLSLQEIAFYLTCPDLNDLGPVISTKFEKFHYHT